jgi:hypothetical protein
MKEGKTYDEYVHEITEEKNVVIDFFKTMKELTS